MNTTLLNIIILTSTFLVAFIPFTGEAYIKPNRGLKKITLRGYLIVFLSLLGGWAAISKDKRAEQQSDIDKALAKQEQRTRDSIGEINRLKSNADIIKNYTEVMSAWGYKLDSQNMSIVKIIKDSSKNTINYGPDPTVGVCNIEYEKIADTNIFKTYYCFKDNPKDIQIDVSVISAISGEYKFRGKLNNLKSYGIAEQNTYISKIYINNSVGNTIYFHYKGSYKNIRNEKFPVDILKSYTLSEGGFGMPASHIETELRELINKNHW